jgi:hypothetical protein
MALPHLIKYVYTNGTDEVIRRGKKFTRSVMWSWWNMMNFLNP